MADRYGLKNRTALDFCPALAHYTLLAKGLVTRLLLQLAGLVFGRAAHEIRGIVGASTAFVLRHVRIGE